MANLAAAAIGSLGATVLAQSHSGNCGSKYTTRSMEQEEMEYVRRQAACRRGLPFAGGAAAARRRGRRPSSRATLCRRCRSSASLRDRRSCSLLGASNLQTSPEDVRAMMRCKQHSSRCKQGKIYAYIHARTDLLRCKLATSRCKAKIYAYMHERIVYACTGERWRNEL